MIPGFWKVGTDKENGHEYIIGVIIAGILCPLVTPRADSNHYFVRVKMLIRGNHASEIVPISKKDPLNRRFLKEFGTENIRSAEVN